MSLVSRLLVDFHRLEEFGLLFLYLLEPFDLLLQFLDTCERLRVAAGPVNRSRISSYFDSQRSLYSCCNLSN